MGSLINIFFYIGLRQKRDRNKLQIDWFLAGLCIPVQLAGTMLGAVLYSWLPGFYVNIFIFVTLIFVCYLTIKKSKI